MPEIKFRDGPRNVPPHVEELLANIDTYKLTYAEAMRQMNNRLMVDHLERAHTKFVADHFRSGR